MIGQRGVPASYGGIERHVEELGASLVELGYDVTVFNRNSYSLEKPAEHRGMSLRYLPTVSTKHLDAAVASFLSTFSALRQRFDIIHYHALGPGIPSFLARYLSKSKVVQTIHGRDGQRDKWGRFARLVLSLGEWQSAHVPHGTITVSRDLTEFYRHHYGIQTWHIPNGAPSPSHQPARQIRERFGLEARQYFLFVGRFVPEKAPDQLIQVFKQTRGTTKLVLAGDSSFTEAFVARVRQLAENDPRIVLTGYAYGELLAELYSNAAAFVLPSRLEGLPLTLLEALAYRIPVIASDIPPHREILGHDGTGKHLFPVDDERALQSCLEKVVANLKAERAAIEEVGPAILEPYQWPRVAAATDSRLIFRSRVLRDPNPTQRARRNFVGF
jgi:glycosyltransferase involved in cell wall biosynthesis